MIDSVSGSSISQGLGVSVDAPADLKMDFLKLLTTQLANQDPLSPMDNEAMVAQLATFTQLEQLQGVNDRLDQQMQYSQSLNNTMMMDVVGKRVTVLGNQVEVSGGDPSRTLIRTVEPGIGTAKIYDRNGDLVRTVSGIQIEPGFTEIAWDGRDDDGETLPDGQYEIRIQAERVGGGQMSVAIFQSGIVDTVQFDNNAISLLVNGRLYSPAAVVEVGRAPSSTNGGSGDGDDDGADDATGIDTEGDGDSTTGGDDPVVPPGVGDDPTSPPVNPDYDPNRGPDISGFGGATGSGPVWRVPWAALRGIR